LFFARFICGRIIRKYSSANMPMMMKNCS